MRSYLITGANRGLGRAIVTALASRVEGRVVLGVRDREAGERAAAEIRQSLGKDCRAELSVEALDLACRRSVEDLIARWDRPLAGLVNNAGLQFEDGPRLNDDGLELTFAVNHLHALRLSLGLLDHLDGGDLVFIGSGTHNPRHPTASRFGFRGDRFETVEDAARGLQQATGKDRYATSKFLNMVSTVELARRIPVERTAVSCLDPGLMPGTDLARTAPAVLRFGWHHVLPRLVRLLPDANTVEGSGRAVAQLLLDPDRPARHGRILNFRRQRSRYATARVFNARLGRTVIDDSIALLERTAPAD